MEFNCSYMGISRITCNKRVRKEPYRIGKINEDRTNDEKAKFI